MWTTPLPYDKIFLPLLSHPTKETALRELAAREWVLRRREHFGLRDFIQRKMPSLPMVLDGRPPSLIRMNVPPDGEKTDMANNGNNQSIIEEKVPVDNKIRLLLHCLDDVDRVLRREFRNAVNVPSFLRMATWQCPDSALATHVRALDEADDQQPDIIWRRLQHLPSAPEEVGRYLHLFMALMYGESWRIDDVSCLIFLWRHRTWVREMVRSIRAIPLSSSVDWISASSMALDTKWTVTTCVKMENWQDHESTMLRTHRFVDVKRARAILQQHKDMVPFHVRAPGDIAPVLASDTGQRVIGANREMAWHRDFVLTTPLTMDRLVLASTIHSIRSRSVGDRPHVWCMPILLTAIRAGVAEEAAWDAAFQLVTGVRHATAPDWFRSPIGRVFQLAPKTDMVAMARDMMETMHMLTTTTTKEIKIMDHPAMRAWMTSTPEEDEDTQTMHDIQDTTDNTTIATIAIFPQLIQLADTLSSTNPEGLSTRKVCREWIHQLAETGLQDSKQEPPRMSSTLAPYETFLLLAEWIHGNCPDGVTLDVPHAHLRHYSFPVPDDQRSVYPLSPLSSAPLSMDARRGVLSDFLQELHKIDVAMADRAKEDIQKSKQRSRSPLPPPRRRRVVKRSPNRRARSRSPARLDQSSNRDPRVHPDRVHMVQRPDTVAPNYDVVAYNPMEDEEGETSPNH